VSNLSIKSKISFRRNTHPHDFCCYSVILSENGLVEYVLCEFYITFVGRLFFVIWITRFIRRQLVIMCITLFKTWVFFVYRCSWKSRCEHWAILSMNAVSEAACWWINRRNTWSRHWQSMKRFKKFLSRSSLTYHWTKHSCYIDECWHSKTIAYKASVTWSKEFAKREDLTICIVEFRKKINCTKKSFIEYDFQNIDTYWDHLVKKQSFDEWLDA
jgi:hypothetical protein